MSKLSKEREFELVSRAKEGCVAAKTELYNQHYRLIVKVSRHYITSKVELDDLIQVASEAFCESIELFDVNHGSESRFATFAMYRMRSYLFTYQKRNAGFANLYSTKGLSKVYANYSKYTKGNASLSKDQIIKMAKDLGIKESDVVEGERRMFTSAISIHRDTEDSNGTEMTMEDILPSGINEPEKDCVDTAYQQALLAVTKAVVDDLNERERDIIAGRLMSEDPVSFKELALRYGVSAQRIEQIQKAAIAKIHKELLPMVA